MTHDDVKCTCGHPRRRHAIGKDTGALCEDCDVCLGFKVAIWWPIDEPPVPWPGVWALHCNGICVMASELIDRAPLGLVAHVHPERELHSWGDPLIENFYDEPVFPREDAKNY